MLFSPRRYSAVRLSVTAQEVISGRRTDHFAAMFTGARSHVDDPVGGADGVFVVLDDKDGVAQVAHALQRLDEAGVVALVQADARFIQDVEDAHELAADLGGQADALRFTAGEGRCRAIERQIVQAYVDHELQACGDLLEHLGGDGLLSGVNGVCRARRRQPLRH